MKDDLIVMFARMWGQLEVEAAGYSEKTRQLARELSAYDSQELLAITSEWADAFVKSDKPDPTDFFYERIKDLTDNTGANDE